MHILQRPCANSRQRMWSQDYLSARMASSRSVQSDSTVRYCLLQRNSRERHCLMQSVQRKQQGPYGSQRVSNQDALAVIKGGADLHSQDHMSQGSQAFLVPWCHHNSVALCMAPDCGTGKPPPCCLAQDLSNFSLQLTSQPILS